MLAGMRRPVLNPHNVTHIAGGSSAGSGAAVAARAAPAALCADSGGSCRSPAAATGTVGFRPSTGCFNAGAGALQLTHLRDSVGVIARSVADAQLLNSVLTDCLPDPLFPPLPNVHAAPLTGLGVHGADIHGPGSAAAAERRRRRLSEGGGAAAGAGGAGEAVNLRGLRIGVAGDLMRDVGGAHARRGSHASCAHQPRNTPLQHPFVPLIPAPACALAPQRR